MAVKRAVKSTKDTIAQNVKAPSTIYKAVYSSSTDGDDEIAVSPPNSSSDSESSVENDKLQSPKKFSAPKINKTTRPPMLLMVSTAIKEVGTEKKGASVQAIRKWILGNYTDIDQSRLKLSLKRAFEKGIQTGVLGRPLNSAEGSGATGSYKLMKKNTEVKEAKAKRSKAKPESLQLHNSDPSEPITKKNKKQTTNSKKTLKQPKIKSEETEVAEPLTEIKSASSDTEIAPKTRKKLVVQKASKSDTDVDDQFETKPKRAQKKPTVKPKRTAAKPGPSSSKTNNKAVKSKATAQKTKSPKKKNSD